MSVDPAGRFTDVWHEVQGWPVQDRLTLASRILQSIETEKVQHASPESLIGVWKSDQPPGDKDVERIIKEERTKKYG